MLKHKKLNTTQRRVNCKLCQTECVQFVMRNAVVVTAADDGVVTIDDDTGEASMMRMMGFSDFSSTKVSLHVLKMTEAIVVSLIFWFNSAIINTFGFKHQHKLLSAFLQQNGHK